MPAAQHRRYSRKSGETGRELLCSKAAPAAIQPAGSKKHPQSGQLRGSGSSATISLKNRIQSNYSMLWKEMQIKVFKNHRSSIGHSKRRYLRGPSNKAKARTPEQSACRWSGKCQKASDNIMCHNSQYDYNDNILVTGAEFFAELIAERLPITK